MGSGIDKLKAFTDLGDKLHKNFSQNFNDITAARQNKRDFMFAKETQAYDRMRAYSDLLQQRRDTLFSKGMTQRQAAMTEKEAALRNQAAQLAIRKAIEEDTDKENLTKNLMMGMMSSINPRRV
jgi:hypothetical protein